jgi:hypothetical protein
MKDQPAFNEWQLYKIINYTHLQNTIVPLYYLAINFKSNITQHALYPGFTTLNFMLLGITVEHTCGVGLYGGSKQ